MTFDDIDRVRASLLEDALLLGPFEGWSSKMLSEAAQAASVDKNAINLAFPDGVASIIDFWSARLDDNMRDAAAAPSFPELRIRDKVFVLLRARLESVRDDKEAFRRAAAFLALPQNATLSIRLIWRSSDAVWRALGDQSNDFNYYSKRTILAAVWTSTAAFWLSQDADDEFEKTEMFLKDRIENVMQFETLKRKLPKGPVSPEDLFGFFGRLRYRSKF